MKKKFRTGDMVHYRIGTEVVEARIEKVIPPIIEDEMTLYNSTWPSRGYAMVFENEISAIPGKTGGLKSLFESISKLKLWRQG